MPFEIIRRHRRKMLAALAILAMFAFVLADSLPQLLQQSPVGPRADVEVATLYGRRVRESDLEALRMQRGRSNFVLSQIALIINLGEGQGFPQPIFPDQFFGDTSIESLVDAYILQREADRLGIPATPRLAKDWIFKQAEQRHQYLNRSLGGMLSPFDPNDIAFQLEAIYRQSFRHQITDDQLLADIANQLRILQAQDLAGQALVTPLDAFESYRDEQEFVSANFVRFPVADFLPEVPEPDEQELRAFYERHKEIIPDPVNGVLGLKLPRRVKVEFLTVGPTTIARLEEKVRTEPIAEEIRALSSFRDDVLEAYRTQIQTETPIGSRALPVDLFAGDEAAELTPPPPAFEDEFLQEQVDQRVEELIQYEIEAFFDPIKRRMYEFAETYEYELSRGRTRTPKPPPQLSELLDPDSQATFREVTTTETTLTPLLADPNITIDVKRPILNLLGLDWSAEQQERIRQILQAAPGVERPTDLTSRFAEEIFSDTALLFDPLEMTDIAGRRFLVWKTEDLPPTVPAFDTIKHVALEQWKRAQARELAQQAAESFAEQVRSAGGDLATIAAAEGKTVQDTLPRAKTSTIAEIPYAGDELREAIFALSENEVVVASDERQDSSYVLTLNERDELDFQRAFALLGGYRDEATQQAEQRRITERMAYLRAQAGLPPDWSPPDFDRSSRRG